jgi:hypothetical protein
MSSGYLAASEAHKLHLIWTAVWPNLLASALWAIPGFIHLDRLARRHHKERMDKWASSKLGELIAKREGTVKSREGGTELNE